MRCSKPADRATVLHEMRREWGDPALTFEERERSMEGILNLNKFVSTRLPDVLQDSKARYQKAMSSAAYEAFELAFGSQ